jgi:hypothetical protein
MITDIKPYLPFYLGCDCQTPDGIGKLVGLPWHIAGNNIASIHFGGMVKTVNSIDGGSEKTRNHGDYAIKELNLVAMATTDSEFHSIHIPGGIKLVLRPLIDMTKDEAIELVRPTVYHKDYINVRVNRNKYNDLVVYWGVGKGIEKFNATGEKFFCMEQFQYLLSNGFDVFGLIDAGLAIDKTTL